MGTPFFVAILFLKVAIKSRNKVINFGFRPKNLIIVFIKRAVSTVVSSYCNICDQFVTKLAAYFLLNSSYSPLFLKIK